MAESKKSKKPKKPKREKKPKSIRLIKIIGPMPILIAICLVGVIIILIASAYFPSYPIDTSVCRTNNDCGWEITNCCPETAGGLWECVNLREFEKPKCPVNVLCPQVISPKPSFECACEAGKCTVR